MTASAVVEPRRELPPDVAALYPFEPRFVDVGDGAEMAVVDEGPRGAEPVVLLHGNPTWGFLYRAFVPPLARAGWRVVVPDHVGCGRSTKVEDPAYYTLARHVANLERALDALDVRNATLVVHDWGGPIGLGWAARHPERVKRLVVLNTVAFVPKRRRPMSYWHRFFAGPLGKPLGQDLNLVVRSAMRFGVLRKLPPDVLRAYLWPYPTPASRAAPLRFARMVPDGPDHPSCGVLREVEAAYPALGKRPAVVLWGDRDPVFPKKWADKWPAALAGVRRVERFEAAHFLQEDAPDALVAATLRFLDETR